MDAVALGKAHDDGDVVGLTVPFQDAVGRVDAVDVQLVGMGGFHEGLAELGVDDAEGFIDALPLDAEVATDLGLRCAITSQ